MMHIGWKKLYSHFDISVISKIKEALQSENIRVKIDSQDPTQKRLFRDVLFGANPLVVNIAGTNSRLTEYIIYVPKENYEYAKSIIERIQRG